MDTVEPLVPPPQYVEYPRDPKFRALTPGERIQLMREGHALLGAVPVLLGAVCIYRVKAWPMDWTGLGLFFIGYLLYWRFKSHLRTAYESLNETYRFVARIGLTFVVIELQKVLPVLPVCILFLAEYWVIQPWLAKVYQGRGWSGRSATYIAIVATCAAIVHMIDFFPFWPSFVFAAAPVVAVAFQAEWLVRAEYHRQGISFRRRPLKSLHRRMTR